MDFIKEKIRVGCENLSRLKESVLSALNFDYIHTSGYKEGTAPPSESEQWRPYVSGSRIEGTDEHYWLRISIPSVPEREHKRLCFSLKTGREGRWDARNPQGLCYIDGKAIQALDTRHTDFPLEFNKSLTMYIYFYTGMEGGDFEISASLLLRDVPTEQLWYDLKVPFDVISLYSESAMQYIKIRDCLNKALLRLDLRNFYSEEYYASVEATRAYLKEELYEKLAESGNGEISCIGHTHIDIAWLWTVAQTREKAERSFSTVLNLMERYPEYKFMSSQPQLYEFVKEANPELYERIKEKIKEGRWFVEGAMWLEADCNLTSGESLVRQLLYGKRFIKDEFGIDSRILWLPDVFGYSAALPQILKKSGVDRFFTSKIAWNETNALPHDVLLWKGIDGTEIFSTFIKDYVSMMTPQFILTRLWNPFRDKSLTDKTLLTFGYGDGGGGPTEEMLETYRRLEHGLPGMPKTVMDDPNSYYDKVEADFYKNTKELRTTPKWDGELYLEMHRGTYTSMARNKRFNRKSELLYQEAEALSVTDMTLLGGDYDSETFRKNEKNILLNQFHDIIPGSCIKEVYEVTDTEYETILSEGRAIADKKLASLAENVSADKGILVYNPTPYPQTDYIKKGGELYLAESIPAHGYKVIEDRPLKSGVIVKERSLENDYLKVTFDEKYQITSVYDKKACREVIAEGSVANRLEVYEDYPRAFDAWEITDYYKQKMWIVDDLSSVEALENGFGVVRKYGNSVIKQDIVLREGSKRLDFVTHVDWHEDHVLLKAAFPFDIRATYATYEIQFGSIMRPTHQNTSWDAAKFEVCGQKWADMSETGYGVSLLNDCKYGYSAYENVMSLSLLKAATYPNPVADRGEHEFTYSLYPHEGNAYEGGTMKEAYLLNMPLEAVGVSKNSGTLPESFSLVSCDKENVCVETVKKAEDDDGIIIRLYESCNRKSTATLTFGFDFKEAYITSLLEEPEERLDVTGRSITLPVKNFEIITLRLVR